MRKAREGSLVSLICDSGDRYASTYYNPDWLKENQIEIQPYREVLETFLDTGNFKSLAIMGALAILLLVALRGVGDGAAPCQRTLVAFSRV